MPGCSSLIQDRSPVAGSRQTCELLPKHGERRASIGDDSDRDRIVDADLLRIQVDLDQRLGDRHSPPVGEDLGETAADGEHGIGPGQGGFRPSRAAMAQRPGLALIDQPFGVESGDHRGMEQFSQAPDLVRGIGPQGASAGQNHRPLGA